MGKFLKLGEQQWTLPEDADLDAIRAELAAAMNEGRAVGLTVELDPKQQAELIVNGRAAQAVLVWAETPVHKPSFTVID